MKSVLSVEALTPALTGIGRYTWELATRLPQHPDIDDIRYHRQERWVKDPASLLHDASPRTKPRLRIKTPRFFRKLSMKWGCRDRIFHGPNYFLPPYAARGVVTIHDLSVFKFPETHPLDRIKEFEREFACSLSRAVHVIAVSEATRQEVMQFLAWPSNKISTVPNGVSPQFAPRSSEQLEPWMGKYGLLQDGYVLCVSTIEPRKGIGNLMKAYQLLPVQLREQYPLVLVGSSGWLSEELHREIDRLSRQGWLRYLGFVPEAGLPFLYAGARSFVYPSSYEGFGLPVLEAMASGVPVVTSDRSSLPEVTQGAALLIDPDDIDALAAGIRKSLEDEVWRATARDQGLAVARTFTWDRCVDETVEVYKKVETGVRRLKVEGLGERQAEGRR